MRRQPVLYQMPSDFGESLALIAFHAAGGFGGLVGGVPDEGDLLLRPAFTVLEEQPVGEGGLFLFLGAPGLGRRVTNQARIGNGIRDSAIAGLVLRTHQRDKVRAQL
jgi:hypothetical protein